jgi:hypothetical protein
VNLKHVLGDIQTDRGNLHVDGSPHVIRLRRTTLWRFDAESGRRPPNQLRTHAPQQTTSLFDHLIGSCGQRRRHGETKRLRGLEIDR